MHAKHPGIAKQWDEKYDTPKDLPEKVKQSAYKRAAERMA